MLTVVLNYLREVLSDIGAVLEFQVIGCDAIGQRNPGKYRNPKGKKSDENQAWGNLPNIAAPPSLPAQRKGGGGIIHGILALSSITLGEPRR